MDDNNTDVLVGSLTGYRCKQCGGSLYVNAMLDSWCSQCSRGGNDIQPLEVAGPYIPVHGRESRIIEALRAKLVEVEREREEFKQAHIAQVEYTHDLIAAYEVERDEARRWARVWKLSAKMWRGDAFNWTSTTDSIGMGESDGDRYRRIK